MSLLKFLRPVGTPGQCPKMNELKTHESKNRALKRSHENDISTDSTETPKEKKKVRPIDLDRGKVDRKWKKIVKENLDLDYTILYSKADARNLMKRCEAELDYNVGHLAKVCLFGKWIDIPRKQVAHGDPGLTYTFSGNTVPARPWTPLLIEIRDLITHVSGYTFNFVLINRYQDGHDYMGEHKDDERDLCSSHPIASLSLGQQRDFVFKHQDSRGKNAKRRIESVSLSLENGSLLLMNSPTNKYWYHSLPKRTRALETRINFTFRKMIPSKCKSLPVQE